MANRLKLNPSAGVPIYRQIMDGVRDLIASSELESGDRLPSIRELASELRINPASAVKAYNELKHAGVIEVDQGRGTFVSSRPGMVSRTRDALLAADLDALLLRAEARGFSTREVMAALRRRTGSRKDGKQ